MNQTALTNWNIALPHLASATSGSVLPVVVGDTTFAIPLEKVRYVDYPDMLTPLPLATAPVEGLARFNNRPLVQISVAQALDLKANGGHGRIVVMSVAQGEVALRVDEVLGFVSTHTTAPNSSEDTTGESASTTNAMPLLKLEDVLPWLNGTGDTINAPEPVIQNHSTRANIAGHILLVATGTQVMALLAESVDRIEELDATLPLRHPDTDADVLIKIEDYLLPARSLARILNCEGGPEHYALIVRGTQHPWALLVERVLRLEKIDRLHSIVSPSGASSIWYLTDDGKVTEVIDAKEFFGVISEEHTQLPVVDPQSRWDNLPQMSANLSTEGVRIYCGDTICILPLALVNRTIGNLGEVITQEQDPDHTDLIPIIDGTMLLEQHPKKGEHCNILLSLCEEKHTVLAVDRASLQPTLPTDQWLPLTVLPPPTSFLFDAANYDEAEGRWVLRVTKKLDSSQFSWSAKRALVNSMLGWIGIDSLGGETH
jgi:chemotaxis signal transduction protein